MFKYGLDILTNYIIIVSKARAEMIGQADRLTAPILFVTSSDRHLTFGITCRYFKSDIKRCLIIFDEYL